ncbi:hypothetical protein [Myceligenerans crystallogenes]|uniref:Dihydrofolate synthase / folylpolyglutamate synthase n=1 Tax=Myceligenerans crystallogenes TaxID=316335 RepID=A0ABP4ZX54_9MICO
MTAQHLPADDAFFAEWAAKAPGQRRSLGRARAVGAELGTWDGTPPVLAVVGSKGKGTTAIHAAAALSAALLPRGAAGAPRRARVGLVTSPGLRVNRERMRFDGAAISPGEYDAEAARLDAARGVVVPDGSGYLSPTGAYTITGAAWAARRGADALVLEEGLGGRSDEVSLFDARVVAVTKVFYEHGDVLGPTLDDVARDLLGVVGHGTRTIVTVEQDPDVTALVEETAAKFDMELVTVGAGSVSCAPAGLPPLTRLNATAGEAAARSLAAGLGWSLGDADVAAALRTVRVPGRMSRLPTPGGPVMLDGAISPEGVRATVAAWRAWRAELGYDTADLGTVVASFPDTKDAEACFAELRDFSRVIPSRADDYLSFARSEALHGDVLPAREALSRGLADGACLVVGTQSFLAIALDVLDVPTTRAYEPLDG